MQLLKQKIEKQQQEPLYIMLPVDTVVFKDKSHCEHSEKKQIRDTDSTLKSGCRKTSVSKNYKIGINLERSLTILIFTNTNIYFINIYLF